MSRNTSVVLWLVAGLVLQFAWSVAPRRLLEELGQVETQADPSIDKLIAHGPEYIANDDPAPWAQLNGARAMAFRTPTELWVVNDRSDSISIVRDIGQSNQSIDNRLDAYAEHFIPHPAGISFDDSGKYFATCHESINEIRHVVFIENEERNFYFASNGFMGPSLFDTTEFAMVQQNKPYRAEWPQHGQNHNNIQFDSLSPENISLLATVQTKKVQGADEISQTYPKTVTDPSTLGEGSHLDMLHESPYAMGIVHHKANAYFLLDGCGHNDAPNFTACSGDGHLTYYDFALDHGPGNGFHGDGLVMRYLDVPFQRAQGVTSGMALQPDGWLYYSNTGEGTVRRVRVEGPGSGTQHVWVRSWNDTLAGENGPLAMGLQQGTGQYTDWEQVHAALPTAPTDGEDMSQIAKWIADKGDEDEMRATEEAGAAGGFDGSFLWPREVLNQYGAVLGAEQEVLVPPGIVATPSGIAFFPGEGDGGPATTMVVADNAPDAESGLCSMHVFERQGEGEAGGGASGGEGAWRHVRSVQTQSTDLQGIAVSPAFPGTVFYADATKNTLRSLKLQ